MKKIVYIIKLVVNIQNKRSYDLFILITVWYNYNGDTMKAIIFDLDGTLWETLEQTYISTNEVVARYPFLKPITRNTIAQGMGYTVSECAELYMPYLADDVRVPILLEILQHDAEYLENHGGNVYPNLESVLKELREHYLLGIVSNCGAGYIESFLKSSHLDKYFIDFVAAGKADLSKSNAIRKLMHRNGIDKAIYVGDTLRDYQASEGANIPFIHAKYGFNPNLNFNYSIKDIKDLPVLLSYLETI